MKWFDFEDPTFISWVSMMLSVLSIFTGIIVTILVYRWSRKDGKSSEDMQRLLVESEYYNRISRLESMIAHMSSSSQVERMSREMNSIKNSSDYKSIINEFNKDMDSIRKTYFSSPFVPIPESSPVSIEEFNLITSTVHARFLGKERHVNELIDVFSKIDKLAKYNNINNWGYGYKLAKVLIDPMTKFSPRGPDQYKDIFIKFPYLISAVLDSEGFPKDHKFDAFRFNILTGLFLACHQLEKYEGKLRIYSPEILKSLANNLHGSDPDLLRIASWKQEDRYIVGSIASENITTLGALFIYTVGAVVKNRIKHDTQQEHCAMRIIQYMKAVMHGVYDNANKYRNSGVNKYYNLGWGYLDSSVFDGMKNIDENEPDSWSECRDGIEEELDNIGSGWRNPKNNNGRNVGDKLC